MNHLDENIYNFINILKNEITQIKGAELLVDFPTYQANYLLIIDSVIIRNNELLAIFEFRPYVKRLRKAEVVVSKIGDLQYRYLIITNGIQIFIYDTYQDNLTLVKSVLNLITTLFSTLTPEQVEAKKKQIAEVMEKVTRNFLAEEKLNRLPDKALNRILGHLSYQTILDNIIYDLNGQFFRLGSDVRLEGNYENQLFNILLEDVPSEALVYRYATIETVFATINYGNMRMNGIAGMNDPTELDYVDHYVDRNYSVFNNANEIKVINNRFIICCSELPDTLNQWRLYGDDCKGACIVLKINNGVYPPGVKIKKISYGRKRNGMPFHAELELLKQLIEAVRQETHQSLQFKSLGIWKHFFKPFEYTEEKEVRILLALNNEQLIKGTGQSVKKEWNLTASHKIIAPFVSIPLNDPILPVQLVAITLGSKCFEKQLNKVQLEVLLKEKSLTSVQVVHSQIDNYR